MSVCTFCSADAAHEKGRKDLPILPMIIARGNEWTFMLAKREENEITIFRDIGLGRIDRTIGMYRLIATIRRLAK